MNWKRVETSEPGGKEADGCGSRGYEVSRVVGTGCWEPPQGTFLERDSGGTIPQKPVHPHQAQSKTQARTKNRVPLM